MPIRKMFETGDGDVNIYMHPDGSVAIEATGEYGDTESGWGSTTKTYTLDPTEARNLAMWILEK